MKEYYVEVYYPPFPSKGRKVRVHCSQRGALDRDTLSPNLISLHWVQAIDRNDALALALMGKAQLVIGKLQGVSHG